MFTKIDELMWKDIKFKKLSIESKLLFVYLLSCQHRNVLGLYNLPKYYIQGDILYPIERVTKGLDELSSNGFIRYDEGSETVLVKNFLKYNPLDNANQVKGAAKVLKTIPKTPLFYDLLDNIKSSDIKRSDELSKAINKYLKANGFERVTKGLPEPMGEQEEVEVEEEVKEEVKEEVEEKELHSANAQDIYDYWIAKEANVQHTKLTKSMAKAIDRKLKEHSKDEIVTAINRLVKAINDKRYYYNKWHLEKFMIQGNGYVDWLEGGARWEAYLSAVGNKGTTINYVDKNRVVDKSN